MLNLLLLTLISLSNATENEVLSVEDESQIETIEQELIEDSEFDLESTETNSPFSELGAYEFGEGVQGVRLIIDRVPMTIKERKRWSVLLNQLTLKYKKSGIKLPVYWEVLK